MKGYKICSMRGNYYISAFSNGNEIIYEIDEWTLPDASCGPLAVFDTLEHALNFITHSAVPRVIFKCKYKPAKEKKMWCYKLTPLGVVRFTFTKAEAPKGTRLARKVKIIGEPIEL